MAKRKPTARGKATLARRRAIDLDLLPTLLGYAIRRAQVVVFNDFAKSMGELAITPGRFGVLAIIEANPDLNQTQLGQALGIDRSTVVSLIDRLEARGWVERMPSPNDRRSYALRLSPAGRELLATLRPKVREHEARIAASLSAVERQQLIALLRRMTGDDGDDSDD